MPTQIAARKAVSVLTAAAIAVTALVATPTYAGTKTTRPSAARSSDITDFSARRRYYRYYRNDAAALGAFAAIAGTIATIAAARQYRHRYYYGYPYGYYGYGYTPYGYPYYSPPYPYW
jgi:hypothetical protein